MVRLLYGGSVKPGKRAELLGVDHVNGALVGGASLKADDFWAYRRGGRLRRQPPRPPGRASGICSAVYGRVAAARPWNPAADRLERSAAPRARPETNPPRTGPRGPVVNGCCLCNEILLVIHLLIALALVGVVLLQRSEGGGLGIGGGTGMMSSRGQSNLLDARDGGAGGGVHGHEPAAGDPGERGVPAVGAGRGGAPCPRPPAAESPADVDAIPDVPTD